MHLLPISSAFHLTEAGRRLYALVKFGGKLTCADVIEGRVMQNNPEKIYGRELARRICYLTIIKEAGLSNSDQLAELAALTESKKAA